MRRGCDEDATRIGLPDGGVINGQSAFVENGVTPMLTSAVLMAAVQGCCGRRNALV
jgi:hypothetical protein